MIAKVEACRSIKLPADCGYFIPHRCAKWSGFDIRYPLDREISFDSDIGKGSRSNGMRMLESDHQPVNLKSPSVPRKTVS